MSPFLGRETFIIYIIYISRTFFRRFLSRFTVVKRNRAVKKVCQPAHENPMDARIVDFGSATWAETINGLYKAEVIWRKRFWPGASAVEMATLR
jgi:hypothetical protein